MAGKIAFRYLFAKWKSHILVEVRESTFYSVPVSNAEWWLKQHDVKGKLPVDRWRPK